MWRISAALLLLSLAGGDNVVISASGVDTTMLSVELMAKFKSWSDYHGREYVSHDEKMRRLQVWLDNDGAYITCLQKAEQGRAPLRGEGEPPSFPSATSGWVLEVFSGKFRRRDIPYSPWFRYSLHARYRTERNVLSRTKPIPT